MIVDCDDPSCPGYGHGCKRTVSGLAAFETLGVRFLGVDLQRRRDRGGCNSPWPAQWRAKLVTSKNERAHYRLIAYGDTMEMAASTLVEMVERIDRSQAP